VPLDLPQRILASPPRELIERLDQFDLGLGSTQEGQQL
jgi:hypothetical protein